MHRKHHDNLLFGVRRAAILKMPQVWKSGSMSVRLVTADSPREYRKVAQELSLVAAGDVDFSFVAYHADEPPDNRDPHIFIGADSDRGVCYAMVERRFQIGECTWEEYESNTVREVSRPGGVWSVSFVWVSRQNRRKGWSRGTLDAASHHLGLSGEPFAWYTPFSPDGEALVRGLCPNGIVIGK